MATGAKDPNAFLTIGELSAELGVPQHVLRYWESKFPRLKPLQRAGNRRYYRASDVDLARRIHRLLSIEGYTVRGVQKLLRDGGEPSAPAAAPVEAVTPQPQPAADSFDYGRLVDLRDRLSAALTN